VTNSSQPERGAGRPSPRAADTRARSAKHGKMLEVLAQFRVLFRSVRRHYRRVEHRAGVTGAQLWALAHLGENPGARMGQLARALAIHPSTASNLVRRLESLALVSRERKGRDQRAVQLYLTAKGAKALRHAPRPLIGVLQQALSELPMRSLDTLERHLDEIIRATKVKDLRARSIPISLME